jgi:hypothetical protein
MTYDEARTSLAAWLEHHALISPDLPHEGYDVMDRDLPRDPDPRWRKIFVALSFWDGWIDASNHDWQYYDPICASDWPVLAREIAFDLRNDREISNPEVVKRFE